jgi:hypothetical protein
MDAKTIATAGLKSVSNRFLQDLQALPEDAFSKSLGGAARTVADIVYEVNLVNDHVGMVVRGEEPFDWPEGYVKAPPDFQTKEAVIDAFERSSHRLLATAEALTPEGIEATIETEDGETTRFERFRFATLHLWYHSGQLNFIQTLLGDADWHWQ